MGSKQTNQKDRELFSEHGPGDPFLKNIIFKVICCVYASSEKLSLSGIAQGLELTTLKCVHS